MKTLTPYHGINLPGTCAAPGSTAGMEDREGAAHAHAGSDSPARNIQDNIGLRRVSV